MTVQETLISVFVLPHHGRGRTWTINTPATHKKISKNNSCKRCCHGAFFTADFSALCSRVPETVQTCSGFLTMRNYEMESAGLESAVSDMPA